jgi:hypothetical protein
MDEVIYAPADGGGTVLTLTKALDVSHADVGGRK